MLGSFETELHTNAIELLSGLDVDLFQQFEFVHSINCVQILNSFEQKELIRLLFIHDQVFTTNYSKDLFILRNLHRNNLIWLSCTIGLSQGDPDFTVINLLVRIDIVENDFISLSDQESIHVFNRKTSGAIQILFNSCDSEVMLKFSSVDIKRTLVGLVSDTILNLTSEHHLRAVHEVEHHILKSGLKCTRINQVEEDLRVCTNLDSFVTLDEVDGTALVKGVVVMPVLLFGKLI